MKLTLAQVLLLSGAAATSLYDYMENDNELMEF